MGTYFPGRGTIVEDSRLKGVEEGRTAERSQTIMRVLEKREMPTPADVREQITGCTDPDLLDRPLDRAFTVTDGADPFAGDREAQQSCAGHRQWLGCLAWAQATVHT
ncbi:hypothetical protein OHS70_07530 [Streptomyces sp. NBC_00390]|uniref:hypothetical protein n=1 Tax=Streptomyces sp. NBC_00390 TaxID=2975736 RepID=UPI002E24D064